MLFYIYGSLFTDQKILFVFRYLMSLSSQTMQASVRLTQGLLMAADAGVLLTLPLVRPVKVSQRHHHRHHRLQHHQHHHHFCWNRIINNVPLRNNLLLVGPVSVKGSHHHHHHHRHHHRHYHLHRHHQRHHHHHLTNSLFHLILSRATKAWRSMTNTIPSDF